MKVSQIPYERYTIEQLKEAFHRFEVAVKNATCARDVLKAREEVEEERKKYSTAASLCNCRFTLDTRDPFYSGEVDYYDGVGPQAQELLVRYGDLLLESPFRAELEERINPLCFRFYELAKKSYSPVVEEDCREENALTTEYSRFMSGMLISFDGQELPLSVVRGSLENPDRAVRQRAAEAIGLALEKNADTLDSIYDKLVKVRTRIAKKLGYENFVELGYYRMGRIDYTREMVAAFRDNVKKDLVPVVAKMKAGIAGDLGIDRINYYDDNVYIQGGNPCPKDGAEGIFQNAQEMYDTMHPEIGAFMREMVEAEAFDVEAREGKWGGGYCTGFDSYCQPFILANFNGTAGDIDVITHEFGHALAAKKSYDCGDYELGVGGMETAECHSMSMEFFCEPFMDKFFENPAAYCRQHLMGALSFIPYGVIVDEFQHNVYQNPDMTPAERKAMYKSLEDKYRPYLNWEGIPYLEQGTRWQYQMHIYESPFYYIDYCLAQTVALGFLVMMRENYGEALDRYLKFLGAGGTKPFSVLVKEAGIANPFEEGSLSRMADTLTRILEEEK